jgi:hypothetical protein
MLDKRIFLAGASALAIMAYSGTALADPPYPEEATGAAVEGSSVVSGNKVIDWMSRRANDISGSFTDGGSGGSSGIAHVQQNNGSANGMENGTAIQGGLSAHVGFVKSKASLDLSTHDNKSIVKGAPDVLVPGVPAVPPTYKKVEDPLNPGTLIDVIDNPGSPAIPAVLKDFNDRENTIGNGSFDGFTGIASVQQNNGDVNQMGIATSILAATGTQDGDGYHKAEVEGSTYNQTGKGAEAHDAEWQSMGVFADAVLDQDSDVLNSISGAFNGAAGIFQVQQNNGNGNSIGSATSVVSTGNFWGTLNGGMNVAGHSYGNAVVDENVTRTNTIEEAFNGSSGAATVQQNNGHSNFMGAATSIVVGVTGPAMTGGLTDATLSNCVTDNAVQVSQGDHYNNNLTTAFNGFAGIAQVQQNNGNANSLASGVHVSVQGLSTTPVPALPFGGAI